MPNIDPAAVNTVLLSIFGIGGSLLVFRYIGPIMRTQDDHRVKQDKEIAVLRAGQESSDKKIEMLQEMVTQRAGVDDLRQFMKISVDESARHQRDAIAVQERNGRDSADQHQQMAMVLREVASVLRGIEYRMGGQDRRDEQFTGRRGPAGPAGPEGERGEKGDHGQDVAVKP